LASPLARGADRPGLGAFGRLAALGIIAIGHGIIAASKSRGLQRYPSLLDVVAGILAIPLSHVWSLVVTNLFS
jgi:hypothetical protein